MGFLIISRGQNVNIGNATVYIDSMALRNNEPFYIEPLGDVNSIEAEVTIYLCLYNIVKYAYTLQGYFRFIYF